MSTTARRFKPSSRTLALAAGIAAAAPAVAQNRSLVADRGLDTLHSIWDRNGNGVIDEPGERTVFFSGANTAGTPGLDNPTALAVRFDDHVLLGDQGIGSLFAFRDLNRDGDALDVGESRIVADPANLSAVSLAFPTGIGFDSLHRAYVVNAGNAFGEDGVYRLIDLTGDGDFQDAGEILEFLGDGAFGPGNGPWAPQEVVFYPTAVVALGFLRNSSAGLHGVYRFIDGDGSGRADDPGEFTPYFTAANLSGIVPSAGFALELDAFRIGSIYTHQIASGGNDQLIRLTDTTGDNDAEDANEAEIVFSSAEAGLSVIDVQSLADGRVLLTDNSGKRVIVLTDLNGDGLFNGATERADYFANTLLAVQDLRQIAAIGPVCQANCDLSVAPPVLNVADFTCFLQAFAAGDLYANCDSSSDQPVLNVADFTCFLQAFAAGCK